MLTDFFYQQLATMLKSGPQSWGPLSIAIGQGEADWDRTPPVLRRGTTQLAAETARKPLTPEDIDYITETGGTSSRPTSRLRLQTTFASGEGTGTLRECGLWAGEGSGEVLLAYFVHPRIEKRESDSLARSIQLDLTPGRPLAQETVTRYLGNSKTEEFHDLENETRACQLDEIRVDRRHYFPTVEEAVNLGYDRCSFCFGREFSES